MSAVFGVLLALFGFTLQSTGLVLTKSGSSWLKWQGERDARFRRSLAIWLLGFVLYNLTFIFTGIASRTLPPHIVSAASGWGIPVMVVLSHILLHEAIFASDFLFAAGIVAGIAALGLLERPSSALPINLGAFYGLMLAPLLLLVPLPLLKSRAGAVRQGADGSPAKPGRARTVLLAIFAGLLGGFTFVIMNVMVRTLAPNLAAYLRSPYPYLFVLVGTVAFVALQMALRQGAMIVVGPLQNAFLIIYPAICSWLVFGVRLGLAQAAAIAAILACCLAILRRH